MEIHGDIQVNHGDMVISMEISTVDHGDLHGYPWRCPWISMEISMVNHGDNLQDPPAARASPPRSPPLPWLTW